MDINPTFNYKNAEIELVVEDDVITTTRVTMESVSMWQTSPMKTETMYLTLQRTELR